MQEFFFSQPRVSHLANLFSPEKLLHVGWLTFVLEALLTRAIGSVEYTLVIEGGVRCRRKEGVSWFCQTFIVEAS